MPCNQRRHELETNCRWRKRDMNGLFPMIRRKRRPLSVPDAPAVELPPATKNGGVEPVAIVPLVESLPDAPPTNRVKSRHAQRPVNIAAP